MYPTTVAGAYEALKPEPVQLGERMGRTVHRQGDIFAVAAPTLTVQSLRRAGARFARDAFLLGTNHRASEVAVLPNGVTLVRGVLTHAPSGRPPDHVERALTPRAVWHVVLKNTVPLDERQAT
ncbi:hypothetical protein GCM10009657_19010 [Oryzihumus leptocrescens]